MTIYQKSTTPFLYAIGWTDPGIYYVGVRYRDGCDPSDLWTTYFTSSRYVTEFRDDLGEPDYREIIATYSSKEAALAAETSAIRDHALHHHPQFLNKNCAGSIVYDSAVRKRISEKLTGRKLSPGQAERSVASRRGQHVTSETRALIREARTGKKASDESRAKMSAAKVGRKRDPSSIAKMVDTKKQTGSGYNRIHNYNGQLYTIKELAAQAGLSVDGLRWRLKNGWSLEEAISTPSKRG